VSRARDVVDVVARALASQPDDVEVVEYERRGQTGSIAGEAGRVARSASRRRWRSAASTA